MIEALRAIEHPPTCVVGGPFAVDAPETPGMVRLPAELDAAVAAVVEILESVGPASLS